MLNAITAQIKLIERNNILRKIITNEIIHAKLAGDGVLQCKEIITWTYSFSPRLLHTKSISLVQVLPAVTV